MALFIPTYFSPISQYAAITKSDEIIFEVEDNFQKQTYRNRCYIYSANGQQLLNIPVKHLKTDGRKKTKDTLVENSFPWQAQHFKSLKSAYRSSPYFEFFEDDLSIIFNKKYKYLLDVNIDTFLFVTDAIESYQKFTKTDIYEVESSKIDFRYLSDAKNNFGIDIPKYTQIFDEKHGFLNNLSVIDLLFMEGGNTSSLLEDITVKGN